MEILVEWEDRKYTSWLVAQGQRITEICRTGLMDRWYVVLVKMHFETRDEAKTAALNAYIEQQKAELAALVEFAGRTVEGL